MATRQFDWLTLSCKALTDNVIGLRDYVFKVLRLDKFKNKFERVGRDKYYTDVYRYNDISLLLPRCDKAFTQGLCIKFSGNGLAFYQEYLKSIGTDLKTVCRRWRSISCNGYFTSCSRMDYALDDKCTADDSPFLTMRRVRESARRGEFRSRLALDRHPENTKVDVGYDTSFKNSDTVGETIYFGKRKGGQVLIRFYDKLLEQKDKNPDIDKNITSWVRCEFEFHDARAMSVFNAFCDKSDEDFAVYMSEVINNYIQFIYIDDSNRSRCTVKRWWVKFVGTSEKSGLIIPPYMAATFSGTENWLDRSVFPTLAYYIKCVGLLRFLDKLRKFFHIEPTPRIKQMVNDFNHIKNNASKIPHNSFSNNDYEYYIIKHGLDPWLVCGDVSALDIKQDFAELGDWSPEALYVDGTQLSLDDFLDELVPKGCF